MPFLCMGLHAACFGMLRQQDLVNLSDSPPLCLPICAVLVGGTYCPCLPFSQALACTCLGSLVEEWQAANVKNSNLILFVSHPSPLSLFEELGLGHDCCGHLFCAHLLAKPLSIFTHGRKKALSHLPQQRGGLPFPGSGAGAGLGWGSLSHLPHYHTPHHTGSLGEGQYVT